MGVRNAGIATLVVGWFLEAVAMTGCLGELGPQREEDPLDRVLATLPGPMAKITERPLPSLAAPGQQIDLWVSVPAQQDYQQVRPDDTGSGIDLPVDAAVLRALRDADGRILKYTALVKQPPGFDPPADLWFGVYDENGEMMRDAAGTPMEGALAACVTCHLTRAEDGFIFGAPRL